MLSDFPLPARAARASAAEPSVAAVIRTYDSARTLAACLDSLAAQTLPPAQIVVVDSGSTDATLAIAEARGCEVVHYPEGVAFNYSRAINIGMEQVRHPLALIVSSHVYLPVADTLATMRGLLADRSDACAASVRGMVRGDHGAQRWGGSPDDIGSAVEWDLVTQANYVARFNAVGISNACNLIWRRDWQVRPFSEAIPRCEDQEWLVHFLARGRTAFRLKSPPIVYDNPHYNDRKEISDLITLAQYGLNPRLTEWKHLVWRTRRVLASIRQRNWSMMQYHVRLLTGLIGVRLGFGPRITSSYF
jgi:glycosyltransferase involved in cell wall biosynthesis